MKATLLNAVQTAMPIALLFILPFGQVARSQEAEHRIESQAPLQADLLVPLDVSKLNVGAPVFLKSRVDWQYASCHVKTGATISGHVVAVNRHSMQHKGSDLTIVFDTADCSGHTSQIFFNLFAVIAEAKDDVSSADFGVFGSRIQPHSGSAGEANAALLMGSRSQALKLPPVIQAGQVFGQKNLMLGVGSGPEDGSVLSTPKGNLRIEIGTQFVLMPKRAPSIEVSAVSGSSSVPSSTNASANPLNSRVVPPPPPVPKAEVDETEICSSSCSVVQSAGPNQSGEIAVSTLPTASLGYIHREKGQYTGFTYDATLTYVDSDNLLFTFDPHKLGQRSSDGIRTESTRTIRAVLLDASTHQVKRILEWQIQDASQYVWYVRPGRVLVHMGHKLYLMDAHLDPIRSVTLPGQLAFISVSPSGDRIAVGTVHELHSPEVHRQLTETLHVEPEEDVDVQIFDNKFERLLSSHQSSSLPPLVLSDTGEIQIDPLDHNHWQVSEYSWNQKNRTLMDVRSVCRPDISMPFPKALFIVGCAATSPLETWYRMLRSDGQPILLGRGSSLEIEQTSSTQNESEFAVRVVHMDHSQNIGSAVQKSNLLDQEISIYRISDGRRLFKATAAVSPIEQSFALSPSGRQLAVLADDGISFYAMPLSPGEKKTQQ